MVEAAIERVRIYHQGATVTRRITLSSPVPAEVEFGGLPLALRDETVQIRCLGEGVVATGVKVGLFATGPDALPEDPDLEALRDLERKIALERAQIALIERECSHLGSLQVPERPRGREGKPPPPSPMRARVALEQLTDTAISERMAERRTRLESLERLEEQHADQLDQIGRASSARRAATHRITKTVRAEIAGSTDQDVVFELDYFVPGARWAPQYRLDIARDGSQATVSLRALICQASGEDWSGVQLELSTAAPLQFTQLPTLSSIRIGKQQAPPKSRGYRPPPRGADALFAGYDRDRKAAAALLAPPPQYAPPEPPLGMAFAMGARMGGSAPVDAIAHDMDDEIEEEMVMAELSADRPAAPPRPKMARSAPAPSPAPGASYGGAKKRKPMRRERAQEMAPAAPPAARFAALRLGDSDRPGARGTLHPTDRADSYRARLAKTGLVIDFDVVERVEQAAQAASRAGSQSLPSGAVEVRGAAGHFDYAYRADDRIDVPSDYAFHSVPLGVRAVPCSLTYVVVPRQDVNVFRMARITNSERAPMLPGPAEVYVDGEYVLTTQMPVVAPKAKFELGLGVEQSIRCARNTRYRESRSGKAVVAMAELQHGITIDLHNHLPRAIDIEVRERIPQPAPDAEVDVEEVTVEPPWEPWDQAETKGPELVGGRRWQIRVPANGEQTLKANYVVKIYANNEISGGNRREA